MHDLRHIIRALDHRALACALVAHGVTPDHVEAVIIASTMRKTAEAALVGIIVDNARIGLCQTAK